MVVLYSRPSRLIAYDPIRIAAPLAEAKAAVMFLTSIPSQRRWVEALQEMQLKREVAGTSRIEGAEFTDRELDAALKETPEDLLTRSQRQAHAAMNTYLWLRRLPSDHPIDGKLIKEVHRRIVTGADDDHCDPGALRTEGQNVTFGVPQHRGVQGGDECREAFEALCHAIEREYPEHDLLVQALAVHYHLGAMHPFLDGNGRTARAMEAVILQRVGLKETLIAMSNYYYDEKFAYLRALSDSRAAGHDLTPFLVFALRGIALQCKRLTSEIVREVQKALYRDVMYDLFNRLRSARKRVIAKRQIEILKLFLDREAIPWMQVIALTKKDYASLGDPIKALVRDVGYLLEIGALSVVAKGVDKNHPGDFLFRIQLDWPKHITETRFFEAAKNMPRGKTYSFLSET